MFWHKTFLRHQIVKVVWKVGTENWTYTCSCGKEWKR